MALYEKNWWKKLFKKSERKSKINVLNDIEAISEFLKEIDKDKTPLLQELEKLAELEKEREVAGSGIVQVNLVTQSKILENIFQQYEYLNNDMAINGLRLKNIAQDFLKKAKQAGLNDLVKEKKQNHKWKLFW